MTKPKRALLTALAVCAIGAAVGGFLYYRSRALDTIQRIVRRLPTGDATVVHVDVAALRSSGLLARLAGSRAMEEPEYRRFVERTGFDYRRDLDSATAAFGAGHVYFLLRGRFDWSALQAYARSQGGGCDGGLCRMPGSRPDRRISFLPLDSGVMGLAAGPNADAAAALDGKPDSTRPISIPADPLWISLAPATLRDLERLPAGTRSFARAAQNADQAMLSLAAAGPAYEARLLVACRSDADAQALAAHLRQTTEMLRKMIARERQTPNPADLSGVLTAGEFRQEGARVHGRWPIQPGFLESVFGGGGE